MSMWDNRFQDFPQRCIRNFEQFAPQAKEDGREVTPVSYTHLVRAGKTTHAGSTLLP